MINTFPIGRTTKNIEIKSTINGKTVANFTLVTDDKNFIPCTAWGKVAETLATYVHKGDQIGVEGKLTSKTWEGNGVKKFSLEVTVINFTFCAKAKGKEVVETSNAFDTVDDLVNQLSSDELPF